MIHPVRRRLVWLCLGGLIALVAPAYVSACSTPVFRYAMYNWATSPYVALYLHHGQPAEADAAVNKLLGQLAQQEPPANVAIEMIDLDDEETIKGYPEPIKALLEAHAKTEEPQHVVISPWPWLVELYSGRLDEAQVKSMVDSPARKKLAELLDQGNAAVMLFVPGKDEGKNKQAREVINKVIEETASGELFPGMLEVLGMVEPMMPAEAGGPAGAEAAGAQATGGEAPAEAVSGGEGQAEEAAGDSPQGSGLKLAMIEVSRTDPAETWLIRTLMSIEPDLDEYADEPMVFGIYGRGRAMPPYVGEGISVDLLADLVAFLLGPCSCTVKAQNPGMDLLVRWDWDATADRMAANDPSLYPDPMMYQEYAVGGEEAGPGEPEVPAVAAVAAAEGVSGQAGQVAGQIEAAGGGTEPLVSGEEPGAAPEAEATSQPEPDGGQQPEAGADDGPEEAQEPADSGGPVPGSSAQTASGAKGGRGSFTAGMAWRLGLGLAVGAVLVLGAGFVLIRKQG